MGSVLKPGEKVHVIFKRAFSEDVRRHFVGLVLEVENSIARIEGFAFVYNHATSEYERRPDRRTRLLGLAPNDVIINLIPNDVDVDAVYYTRIDENLVATDGAAFTLDINEFGIRS